MTTAADVDPDVPRALQGPVGLIGDVHAEDACLQAAISAMHDQGTTHILCVGDIADGRGDLDRTIALLVAHDVICVRGNHDRWALDGTNVGMDEAIIPSATARTFLAGLVPTRSFTTPLGGLLLCHGVGGDDMAELRPDTFGYALDVLDELTELRSRPDIAIMVGGHTHEAMVRHFEGLWVVNAGTLRRVDERAPVFCVLDLDAAIVHRFELDAALTPSLVRSDSLA